jgi:hypothetical protein
VERGENYKKNSMTRVEDREARIVVEHVNFLEEEERDKVEVGRTEGWSWAEMVVVVVSGGCFAWKQVR